MPINTSSKRKGSKAMVTKYTRIENCWGYQNITEVDSSGVYFQRSVWPDGIVTSSYKTTIYEMGWKSLREFLQHRPHFKKNETDA